jgi:hypothetical protein
MRHVRTHGDRATEWQRGILARRPVKVAVLAQAAKTARIVWAELAKVPTTESRWNASGGGTDVRRGISPAGSDRGLS